MPTPEEQVRAIIASAWTTIAPDVVAFVRDEINTADPPPSKPGESPHRKSGELWDGIQASVDDSKGVTLNIASMAPHSIFLRDGTSRGLAPRDFFNQAAADRYGAFVQRRTEEVVNP